jgi:hypothetical protein
MLSMFPPLYVPGMPHFHLTADVLRTRRTSRDWRKHLPATYYCCRIDISNVQATNQQCVCILALVAV